MVNRRAFNKAVFMTAATVITMSTMERPSLAEQSKRTGFIAPAEESRHS